MELNVREIQQEDIDPLADYWYEAKPSFLKGMGVDISKMPTEDEFRQQVSQQLTQSYSEKKAYAIIWLADGVAIGHCNVNKIRYGEDASMHLHLWNADLRRKGAGRELVKMSVPYFFNNLKLKMLYCEPYALNEAPGNALRKAGFEFVKEYTTVPGYISFEQPVKRWEMSFEKFKSLKPD
jgi:RimJ/RimL family protein N-acetyltransferase